MSTPNWKMPVPELGDCVLYSNDFRGFTDPAVGWVIGVGDTTISILTFTPSGFVQRPSVHHKDDPALQGEHGWQDLGVWQFTKSAAVLRELTSPPEKNSGRTSGSK